jgi:hypothetical protein
MTTLTSESETNMQHLRPALVAGVVTVFAVSNSMAATQTAAAVPAAKAAGDAPKVRALRTNNLTNPIGLDDTAPLLSWQVEGGLGQTAYKIRTARSIADLLRGHIEATSGRVRSAQQNNVPFTELDLKSRDSVAWQVRIWDESGRVSAWSAPATWEMGLIGNDSWDAEWIENPDYDYTQADGTETPLPVFGKTFKLSRRVESARLYMTGLGMYAGSINGAPIGKAVLEPGQTTYADEVNYRTYDVTSALQKGRNVIGVETGSGAYQRVETPGHYFFGGQLEQFTVYGEPKVIAQLEITFRNGLRRTIASNETWKTAFGATTYSSWWSGEEYDARRASFEPSSASNLDSAGWEPAGLVELDETTTPRASTPLRADPRPPVTIMKRLSPQSIRKVGNSWLLDFGTEHSAFPSVKTSAPAGTTITMSPSEQINPDGSLNTDSMGFSEDEPDKIAYKYTAAGGQNERWHPQFTYNGFRYLRIDGLEERPTRSMFKALTVYASNPRASSFTSSNRMLNQIHRMTLRSTQSNMASVLTDTPNREKGPYTGDNLHNIDTLLTQYDMSAYQPQLVRNMATAQREPGDESPGLIANIAPEYHRVLPIKLDFPQGVIEFLDEVNWGGAIIRVPWQLYKVYGDTRTMELYYDNMVAWLDYEAVNRAENDGEIPGLGDWSAFDNTTPMQLVIYAGYYSAADEMSKIAGVLNNPEDVVKYRALADELAETFNDRFRKTDESGVYYGSDSETSNAMALDAGLVPAADRATVEARLVAAVRRSDNHITTGSVGMGAVFRALQAAGRDDVIYDMVVNRTAPGYGYMLAQGNTTLSENFSGGGSQNHHFLGQVDNWFVSGVAGINQAPGSVGFRDLVIKPAVVGNLTHAIGTYETPYGQVTSSWRKSSSGRVTLEVVVPTGTTATVHLPKGTTTVTTGRGKPRRSADPSPLEVGPGTYTFEVTR